MNWIRGAFCLILTCCAIVLTLDLHRLMPKLGAVLDNVQAIETNTTRTEAEMSGLLNTARHVALDEKTATTKQLAALDALTKRAGKLLDDADSTMKHLDQAAAQLGVIGGTTNDAIGKIAIDAHDTLNAATADLVDPALKASLAHLDESAASLAIATKEAAGATADIHKVTEYEAKQIMKPVTTVKRVSLVVTRFIGAFLGY